MAYRTRIFWFLAYRTRNVKFEATDLKRSCFGVWLIERGILHLERASCGLWLTEQGMLHWKHRAGRREPWERGCLLTCLSILLAILRRCKKGPFPSFGLVFRMKQHLTKLHYPLFLTVGQSRVLNL